MAERELRILLVEDCSLTMQQLTELLHSLPYKVALFTATTERAAVALATQEHPDLAVLDLNLKRGSGFRVLQAFRTLSPSPVAIVLTNFALPQYRDLALLMGAHCFLDKALDFDALPSVIHAVATQRDASFQPAEGVRVANADSFIRRPAESSEIQRR